MKDELKAENLKIKNIQKKRFSPEPLTESNKYSFFQENAMKNSLIKKCLIERCILKKNLYRELILLYFNILLIIIQCCLRIKKNCIDDDLIIFLEIVYINHINMIINKTL